MRLLIAIACAVLLTACAATPKQNPVSGTAKPGVVVAGTLSLGPCEMSVAPYQTRIAVVAQKAAARVNRGSLDLATAREIHSKASSLARIAEDVCRYSREIRPVDESRARDTLDLDVPQLESMLNRSKQP